MKKRGFLVFALIVICIGFSTFKSFAQTSDVAANAERISGDKFDFSSTTSEGANVYSYQEISPEQLKAIDQGLDELFAIARKYKYYSHLNYSDYTIYIARPDRLKNAEGSYSPGIAINSAQYAGSQYDQGGFIYVAGMVIANDPSAFVIVDYDNQNLSSTSEIVRYEGEHLILYYNDRGLYKRTVDHSKGGGHPILN